MIGAYFWPVLRIMNGTIWRRRLLNATIICLVVGCNDDTTSTLGEVDRTGNDRVESNESRSTFHILPDGSEISLPKHGAAAEIIEFLESSGESIDSTVRCDGIFFGEVNSEIDLERSRSELESVAAVLRAYRKASTEIIVRSVPGSDGDQELAQQRSRALANELIMLGVDGGSMQAAGITTTNADPEYTVEIRVLK